jgi:two-component system chemotaxis sensor kinase CheA
MDEILKEFLIESYENLDRLDRDLVTLEKEPHDKETLASVFRTIHTLKGSSGFLGLTQLEAVAHVGENLLSKMRDGQLVINPEIASALLATVDAVRQMLGDVEANGQIGDRDNSDLIATLVRLNESPLGGKKSGAQASAVHPAPAPATVNAPDEEKAPASVRAHAAEPHKTAESPSPSAPLPSSVPVPTERAKSVQEPGKNPAPQTESSETRNHSASESSIRVDVGLLDKLMNLVGELVLARNQVLQFTSQSTDSAFTATSQRLNLITTELQGSVMKTRMQPIGNIWGKLPRVVRDLSASCGKEVRLEMEGQETELDKTIIEAIKDPLTHIVRKPGQHRDQRRRRGCGRGTRETKGRVARTHHQRASRPNERP